MSEKRSIRDLSKEEILHHLLKKQLGYYNVVLELTKQEHDLLETSRSLDQVKVLMNKKNIILSIIEEIDQALLPIKKRWFADKERDHPLARSVEQQINELDSTLKKTLEIDADNQRLFQEKLRTLREAAKRGEKVK